MFPCLMPCRQFYQACRTGIMDQALSVYFLLGWLGGDLLNLIGSFLADQLPLQVPGGSQTARPQGGGRGWQLLDAALGARDPNCRGCSLSAPWKCSPLPFWACSLFPRLWSILSQGCSLLPPW